MLRSMIFKNFVKFREFQSVEFENGVNVIIGGNGTGKSVILELIRRCMSVDASMSTTRPHDDRFSAYTICRFDNIPKLRTKESKYDIFLTGVWVKEDSKQEIIWIKFICLIAQATAISFAEKYSVDEKGFHLIGSAKVVYKNKEFEKKQQLFSFDIRNMQKKQDQTEKEITQLIDLFEQTFAPNKDMHEEFTKILNDLTDCYVATFALRSIGPAQWSKSEAFRQPKRENYTYASMKAEIINNLIREVGGSYYRKILNNLTFPEECRIEQINNEIKVNGTELLKTPEGIIEGIQFALVLANPKYKTICLEEPDRCMHPQMVEKMHGILTKITDKVIIIVTHNPFLLSRQTILKTHVCLRRFVPHSEPLLAYVPKKKRKLEFGNGRNEQEKRESEEQSTSDVNLPRKTRSSVLKLKDKVITHHVRSVHVFGHPYLDQERKIKVDPRNFLTDVDDLRKLLFSSRIFCVEGKSDKIILEAIIEFLQDSRNDDMFSELDISENAKQFIGSHQIITLGSNTMECKLRAFCESMEIPCSFILDRNAYVKLKKNKTEIKEVRLTGISTKQIKVPKTLSEFLADKEGFEQLEKILAERNIFIWKSGNIEDMLEVGLRSKISTYFQCKSGEKDKIKRGIFDMTSDDLTNLLKDIFLSDDIKRLIIFMKNLWEKI